MRIALVAPLGIPVPPIHYGGIERMVDLLAKGLSDLGHDVQLFAHAESQTAGQLSPWKSDQWLRNALSLAWQSVRGRFDMVNCFGPARLALPALALGQPTLLSFHSPIPIKTVRLARKIAGRRAFFSSVSDSMRPGSLDFPWWRTIHNGIDTSIYRPQLSRDNDAPFVFLGRIEALKGAHLAVEIAQRLGRRLVLAGNVDKENVVFFDEKIRPHLDGDRIRYAGVVDDRQKNDLLGQAYALLAPIQWDEPFGLVVIEAMACGTPVIGFRRASFPEIIRDGVTGILADDVDEACARAEQVASIDRPTVRREVESRFSAQAMTRRHLDYYEHIIGRVGARFQSLRPDTQAANV